jgi:3-phenylpropionate/cinnamic acid dioxygenase small subunit
MPSPAGLELYHEIEQLYFREARLFADKRYREWLETMVDREVHYWLPIFEERYRADRKPPPEFPPSIYDDNYRDLEERIERLETNQVWMEDPPSRIRHLITNLEVYHTDESAELETFSNFLISRNRREREQTMLIGGREDRLRRNPDGWRLLRRKIIVPQRVVLDTNLYYLI